MDELSPEQIEELKRKFTELTGSTAAAEKLIKAMGDVAKNTGKSLESVYKNLANLDKEIARNKVTMGGLAKEMLTGKKIYRDLSYEVDNLNDKIEDLADASTKEAIEKRLALIATRDAIQKQNQENAARRASIEGIVSFTKATTGIAGKTMGGFVKGLQDGSSAFALAGGLMEGALDTANAGAQAVGGGLATMGTALASSANPKLRILGIAAAATGISISKLGDAATAVSKVIVNYMVKQMELTVDAFNKSSSAGALFADGMSGMINSATDAGLTVQQFGDVMKNNSEQLAQSGMGVGTAARLMGDVGKVMKTTGITQNLLRLGIGFQEQSELVTQVMADLRTANSSILKDPAKIAQVTEDYATNLRTIAAITGQDAKKKMEEARQANTNIAIRQKLRDIEAKFPGTTEKYYQAIATMNQTTVKNIQDTLLFGGAVNKTGAIVAGLNPSLNEFTNQFAGNMLNGVVDVTKAQQDYAKVTNDVRDNSANYAVGLAGHVGKLGDVNTALSSFVTDSDKQTVAGVTAAQESAKAQKTATDKFTGNVVFAATKAQEMAVTLQKITLNELDNFAYYTRLITTEISKQLDDLRGSGAGGKAPEGPGFFERMGINHGGKIGAGIAGAGTALIGGAAALPTGGASLVGTAAALGGSMAVGGGIGAEFGPMIGKSIDKFFGGGARDNAPTGAGRLGPNTTSNYPPSVLNALKSNEAIAGGPADQKVLDAIVRLQQKYPGLIVNGINDQWHQLNKPTSEHTRGRAADLNIPGMSNDPKFLSAVNEAIAGLGKAGFHTSGTAPHVHIDALDKGGILGSDQIGLVGENGPELVSGPGAVTSRNNTNQLFEKMNKNLEHLIVLTKESNYTSDKLLRATA